MDKLFVVTILIQSCIVAAYTVCMLTLSLWLRAPWRWHNNAETFRISI